VPFISHDTLFCTDCVRRNTVAVVALLLVVSVLLLHVLLQHVDDGAAGAHMAELDKEPQHVVQRAHAVCVCGSFCR
jgi:hypothetical protein